LKYIKAYYDRMIDPTGRIFRYTPDDYNLDHINAGKVLFRLYQSTADERYKTAISLLRKQLRHHPRTAKGGFWHKQIYPQQMWLDGIYMAAPFYAQFAATFDEPEAFDDIAHQMTLSAQQTRDPYSGLFYHAWDSAKQQPWANPETGCSPHFWGRAMGWCAMALVDVLDYFPEQHPQRPAIITILREMVPALSAVQDSTTGLWYQVLDQGQRPGNYHEASASCMFVYAIGKGVRQGYLDTEAKNIAHNGYQGILKHLIEVDEHGLVNLHQNCAVAGLGKFKPDMRYRDGSYEYYISEPVVTNDYKGVGAFILASAEMEQ
jgi:unsaturated rhamnogalacturonyl hydrolase